MSVLSSGFLIFPRKIKDRWWKDIFEEFIRRLDALENSLDHVAVLTK